jgi:DHA2 family multidrug resistance protein
MSPEIPTAHTRDRDELWQPRFSPWLVAGSVILATFMEVLDTTIVAVCLPTMAGNLGATMEEATWVLTSYLISNAIILPASGWLAIYFGRKRFLMTCVGIFTFASCLCGIAPTMPILILARVLQGAGGGALQPLAQAILLESFPPNKRGMAMAIFGLCIVVAPVIGPTLGGWLTDNYSWRLIFNINIPVGILALFLMTRFLEDPPYIKNAKPGGIDGLGFGFMILWLATLQIVLDKGQQEDWFASAWIRWFTVISMSAMLAFIIRELRTPHPIVNLKVFKNWNYAVGTTLMTIFGAALYSTLTLLPLFLQTLLGYTAAISGLATSPRGIGSFIAMLFVGRLINKIEAKWLLTFGIVMLTYSTLMFGGLNLDIAMGNVIWPNFLQGISLGFVFVPLTTITMGMLRKDQMGNATGIFNLMRNLGGSVGISIATTMLARDAQSHQAILVGHMTPYDPAFQQHLAAIQHGLTPLAGAPQAKVQAYAMMNGILVQQATLGAFMDTFLHITMALSLCLPLALLMRKVVAHGITAVD